MDTMEELQSKHKKELRDVEGKARALLRGISRKDKKKKKELQEKGQAMIEEVKARHQQEMAALEGSDAPETSIPVPEKEEIVDTMPIQERTPKKKSRQQKRKERKAAEEAARRAQVEAELKDQPDPRKLEMEAIMHQLQSLSLCEREIPADGDCLYNAIASQLDPSMFSEEITLQQQLRNMAAQWIRNHQEDFVPFMMDDGGGIPDVEMYCEKVEGKMWGGQLETRALAVYLRRQIVVYRQDGEPLVMGEEFGGPPLRVAYYERKFGLGAHYNAVVDQ